ncbi:hypothetical protein ACOYR1_06390 [Thalassotalea piscium]
MKLPTPIYEHLPYFYFAFSGYLLIQGDEIVFILPALLFYGAACSTLVMRSAHRRKDKRPQLKQFTTPEKIYEYTPYGFIAIAMVSLRLTVTPYTQFIAFALSVLSIRNILLRHFNRSRAKALF